MLCVVSNGFLAPSSVATHLLIPTTPANHEPIHSSHLSKVARDAVADRSDKNEAE